MSHKCFCVVCLRISAAQNETEKKQEQFSIGSIQPTTVNANA